MNHVLPVIALAASIGLPLAAGAVHGAASDTGAQPQVAVVPADAIQWGAAPPSLPPGAQAAVLLGHPSKEGPFVLRLKFPAGFVVPPHRHSKDELVTVISGGFAISNGEKLDRSALKALPPGSFVHIPAGTPHFAWAQAESVVQINGVGPFDVIYVDPKDDPRRQ
jgi:quercetin dioxygenase-like cupin family protein